MTFKEKVQSMTASEIIMAMVEGLRDPHVEIDMSTFGMTREGVCYGCAATNTICKLQDVRPYNVSLHTWRDKMIAYDISVAETWFTKRFEFAIDNLRKGHIRSYNYLAREIDIATIDLTKDEMEDLENELPELDNDYTEEQLQQYERLSERLNG